MTALRKEGLHRVEKGNSSIRAAEEGRRKGRQKVDEIRVLTRFSDCRSNVLTFGSYVFVEVVLPSLVISIPTYYLKA
jgi:hypothetical protein